MDLSSIGPSLEYLERVKFLTDRISRSKNERSVLESQYENILKSSQKPMSKEHKEYEEYLSKLITNSEIGIARNKSYLDNLSKESLIRSNLNVKNNLRHLRKLKNEYEKYINDHLENQNLRRRSSILKNYPIEDSQNEIDGDVIVHENVTDLENSVVSTNVKDKTEVDNITDEVLNRSLSEKCISTPTSPKKKVPNELIKSGFFRLLDSLQNKIIEHPGTFSYGQGILSDEIHMKIINKSNRLGDLSVFSKEELSTVVVDDLQILLARLQNGCLLTDEIINKKLTTISEEKFKLLIFHNDVEIWNNLYSHFMFLIERNVLSIDTICEIFVPLMVHERSRSVRNAKLRIKEILRRSLEYESTSLNNSQVTNPPQNVSESSEEDYEVPDSSRNLKVLNYENFLSSMNQSKSQIVSQDSVTDDDDAFKPRSKESNPPNIDNESVSLIDSVKTENTVSSPKHIAANLKSSLTPRSIYQSDIESESDDNLQTKTSNDDFDDFYS